MAAPAVATPPNSTSVPPSAPSPGSDLVAPPAPDHTWHSPDLDKGGENLLGQSMLSYAAGDDPPAGDANDVVRHRGFRKALLIILICGALIRLLSSPAYLKFIRDTLDPKSF
jgi:hypothetical protein